MSRRPGSRWPGVSCPSPIRERSAHASCTPIGTSASRSMVTSSKLTSAWPGGLSTDGLRISATLALAGPVAQCASQLLHYEYGGGAERARECPDRGGGTRGEPCRGTPGRSRGGRSGLPPHEKRAGGSGGHDAPHRQNHPLGRV